MKTDDMLTRLALALFFAWLLLVNLYRVEANDVFIHLRVGADILLTRAFPRVDTYSVVAQGRPFIAHEWLSGVVFTGIDRAFGGIGLSVLQTVCPATVALVLYRSLGARARDTLFALPVLGLGSYVVAYRVHVRPHLFSLLIVSLVVLALEKWRREGSVRRLWWLVPLQVAWVNLHGEYLLGPVLVATVLGAVGLLVLVPRLQGSAEPRRYTGRDVRDLALLCFALLAASLLNPYGARIFAFSLEMWSGNDYIKKVVFEWQGTFVPANLRSYWLMAYSVLLVGSWVCVLARARSRPVIDAALLMAVTLLSIRSQRFVAHLAIVSVPILLHSLGQLRRRPTLEIVGAMGLIVYALARGYAFSPVSHRPVGWGYGGAMPYAEVSFLEQSQLYGAIYNEYSDGALIIGRLAPRIRPVMDSRIDVYGETLYQEYAQSRSSPERFYAYLAKYQCNLVLLMSLPNRHILENLGHNPDWRLALRTGERFLFVRADAK